MLSNRLAFAALVIACIGAAAGGGYLATRQNTIPAAASAQVQTPAQAPEPSTAAGSGAAVIAPTAAAPANAVKETEGVIGDASPRTATVTKPAAPRPAEAPTAHERPAAKATAVRKDPPPTLTSSWPASANSQPPAAPAPPAVENPAPAPKPEEHAAQEPARAPEPPARTFEELVVSADSVLGLQTENRLSSETARVEDRIDARVTRDVRVDGRVAIPAGSRVLGSVTEVERGGKVKERARLGVRFHTLVLGDGSEVPLRTEPVYRDGESPAGDTTKKVGGAAVGGAILGAILGGKKGAAIGAATGVAGGTAAVMAGDRNAATLSRGEVVTPKLSAPATITVERRE